MKKGIKIIAIMLATFMSVTYVKADTTYNIMKNDYITNTSIKGGCSKSNKGYTYTNWEQFISNEENKEKFDLLYNNIKEMYEDSYQGYYYETLVQIFTETNENNNVYGIVITRMISENATHFDGAIYEDIRYLTAYYEKEKGYHYDYDTNRNGFLNIFENTKSNNETEISYTCSNTQNKYVLQIIDPDDNNPFTTDYNKYIPTLNFETNLPIENQNKLNNNTTVNITNENNIILETYLPNTPYPLIYSENYDPEENVDWKEVNLDNYKYVLLTLKDYNKKDAFTTNLQVKGQVGITPIYNYGQTSKDAITGTKVQDRCNVNYENYTTYPLYILKQDLQNNSIYAVKECSQGSSFKYDNKIFNIFYVTEENESDPTVTINGQTYHTIPFEDLPSTANKNEEENYIPGQSGSINDTGGLDGAIKGIQQKMSEIWDTITYFTQFIGMIFSVFPEEIRIILLSSFTIAITIGLIKIFIK